jgi:hypothetical protein
MAMQYDTKMPTAMIKPKHAQQSEHATETGGSSGFMGCATSVS